MNRRIAIYHTLWFRVVLWLVLFAAALMAGIMLLVERNMREVLILEGIDKGVGIARGLALNVEDPLLTGDDIYLFSAVRSAEQSPGISYAYIVDAKNKVRAASDLQQVGKPLMLERTPYGADTGATYRVTRAGWEGDEVFDLEVPIVTLGEQRLTLGAIHLGLGQESIRAAVSQMRIKLFGLALAALIVGGVVAALMSRFFVRPVNLLVDGVHAIGAGNFEQRIQLARKDEIGQLTVAFNEMAQSLREKEFIKNTLERYVSKELAEQILQQQTIKLGGEERVVTILFCDIRRFTSLAEEYPATEVVEFLNEFFSRMIRVINEHGGMVDKLLGDAVMALFGAPVALGDDALRAVRCAVEMQQEAERLNRDSEELEMPPLEMGIGINTGPVVAGNIGSETRMEYTVIGDNVNVAARLQGVAKLGEVMISEGTLNEIADSVEVTKLDPMTLKGKQKPVGVFRVDRLLDPST
ncbi:MAG: hypothetical protein C0624_05385 [Desulfuromonas sp.]|nr:MAG: hypothetical protein C0624_05385 [Desulfuromonas sp.]